jgi:hypothetical protein
VRHSATWECTRARGCQLWAYACCCWTCRSPPTLPVRRQSDGKAVEQVSKMSQVLRISVTPAGFLRPQLQAYASQTARWVWIACAHNALSPQMDALPVSPAKDLTSAEQRLMVPTGQEARRMSAAALGTHVSDVRPDQRLKPWRGRAGHCRARPGTRALGGQPRSSPPEALTVSRGLSAALSIHLHGSARASERESESAEGRPAQAPAAVFVWIPFWRRGRSH